MVYQLSKSLGGAGAHLGGGARAPLNAALVHVLVSLEVGHEQL